MNRMICQVDMVLCKEQLENKSRSWVMREAEVLKVSKDHASPEAWKLGVLLVASEAFPSLQLSHGIGTRLLAFESRQHPSTDKQGGLVALPCAFIPHVCKIHSRSGKPVAHP